ncbi:ABC transporter permease [Allorhizobium sp. BGMRC 0089]|uniref:ABC transporter permease n=1 Tax=Allorhizobium sonneratiae TaxID=2934936 RepID=UPI002033E652|nr:ABC transporter permease [Allorhizobium sonneratiae]MCM2293277.1 ABC transporter permease [Allorhizobium sonneratiae]
MLTFIIKRIVSLVLTLAVVSLLIFTIMSVLPGDPAAIMLGTSARPDTLMALRHTMGLDQPLLARYLHWLAGVLTGNMGVSSTYGVPVAGLIWVRLQLTLPLALFAIGLAMAIALPLGVVSARRRRGPVDYLVGLLSQAFIAIPAFWMGLLLIMVFSLFLPWLPAGGFPGWQSGVIKALAALVLPAIALALPQAGVLTRVTRTAVLEVMQEDFVRTAIAKGMSEGAALWRHGLPNAAIPVVTVLGLQFTFLIAGSVIVENLFDLPGLGRLAYQALTQRDLIVMQDVVLLFAAIVIVVNGLVDISYRLIDPRVREQAL